MVLEHLLNGKKTDPDQPPNTVTKDVINTQSVPCFMSKGCVKSFSVNSKEELLEKLKELKGKDETSREYETTAVNIAVSKQPDDFEKWLKEIIDNDEETAFQAFCVLFDYYRRRFDWDDERTLVIAYKNKFVSKHDIFIHYELIMNIDCGLTKDRLDLLERAEKNMNNIPEHPGLYNAYCEIIALILEDPDVNYKEDRDGLLEKGLTTIEKALKEKYPKFYCTKARLLSLKGEHSEALKNIEIAISKEDSSKTDYSIRISNYFYYRFMIQERRQMDELMKESIALSSEIKTFGNDIRTIQAKNIEILTFFAGIITFTIGGLNIAATISDSYPVKAAGLIIVLMGALLCVFSLFETVIWNSNNGVGNKRKF